MSLFSLHMHVSWEPDAVHSHALTALGEQSNRIRCWCNHLTPLLLHELTKLVMYHRVKRYNYDIDPKETVSSLTSFHFFKCWCNISHECLLTLHCSMMTHTCTHCQLIATAWTLTTIELVCIVPAIGEDPTGVWSHVLVVCSSYAVFIGWLHKTSCYDNALWAGCTNASAMTGRQLWLCNVAVSWADCSLIN